MSQKDSDKINNTNVTKDNKIQEIISNQNLASNNKNNSSTTTDNISQTNNTNLPENKDVNFEQDSEELGTESTVSTVTQNSKEEKKWEILSPEEMSKRFNEANKIKEEGNKFYNESKFHEVRYHFFG
jgi:GH35 family endo-1,4-beta-xylanase